MIVDETWDQFFKLFLDERAERIYSLIENHTTGQAAKMSSLYGPQFDTIEEKSVLEKPRLKDMILQGNVKVGERVFTRKNPTRFASIRDGEHVEFEGQVITINSWGQLMTGWSSISIYDSVLLERTGKPLKSLRELELNFEGD